LPSIVTSFGPTSGLPSYLSANTSILPLLSSVRVMRGVPDSFTPGRSNDAPSQAIKRPCGSMSKPLARLLFSRQMDSCPSVASFMMRRLMMSVK
jgi:hypothetical protein